MGLGDFIKGVGKFDLDMLQHPIDTLRGVTGMGNAMQAPGVGGPAKDPSLLKQDPTTGLWFDPSTGTAYTDNQGTTPVANPNVAQQVASNFANQQGMLDRLRTSDARSAAAYSGEMGLAGDLGRTIHDVNAPSVAQQQLNQGLEQIQRQQLSQAASVGGEGGVLARLLAANNTAQAAGQQNQASALTRAGEVQGAQQNLGSLLGNVANQAQQGASMDTSGALGFGGLAAHGADTQLAAQLQQANQSQKNKQDFFTNLMKMVGLAGSIGSSGGGAPGAGPGASGAGAGGGAGGAGASAAAA